MGGLLVWVLFWRLPGRVRIWYYIYNNDNVLWHDRMDWAIILMYNNIIMTKKKNYREIDGTENRIVRVLRIGSACICTQTAMRRVHKIIDNINNNDFPFVIRCVSETRRVDRPRTVYICWNYDEIRLPRGSCGSRYKL